MYLGHFDEAINISSKAAELLQAAGDTEGAGYALYTSAMANVFTANYDRALNLQEDTVRMLDQTFALRVYVHVWVVGSVACSHLGRLDEAVEMGQEALRKAQEYGVNSLITWAAATISAAYTCKRELARAIEHGEQAVAIAQIAADKAFGAHILGWALCHAGETGKGIELLAGLHQMLRPTGVLLMSIPIISYLAEGYWLAGEYDNGKQAAQESLELSEQCGASYFLGRGHRFLGEIASNSKPNEAGPHFDKAISIFQQIKAENELALAYSGLGRHHKHQGDVDQARKYLTQALAIFERLGTLVEPDKVRKELAELAH
jgi:tetratricopeptide (TPR) repeat protein